MAKEVIPADELAARRLAREREVKKEKQKLKQQESDDADLSEKQLTNKLCMELADLMGGPILGFKCHVYEDEKGARKPLIENDRREVSFVEPEKITAAIFQFVRLKALSDSRYLWNMREVESCYSMWLKRQDTVRDVKMFDWLSGEGLTFKRLAFDFERKDAYCHPTWDKVLASMALNSDYFQYFIGSIFEPRSDTQGYLWMYGQGRNAKGSILRFLKSVMGNICKSSPVPDDSNKRFFTMKLEHKRLCYFPDVTDLGFVRTGFWKSLTGGDDVDVEIKGGGFHDLHNTCKLIVGSNDTPDIKSSRDDMRRVIFIELNDMEDVDNFEDNLWSEASEFISHCLKQYQDAYENSGFKAFDMSESLANKSLAEDYESFFDGVFDKNFEIGENYLLPVRKMDYVLDRVFHGSTRKKKDFKAWFKRQYKPAAPIGRQYEKKLCKCYVGFRANITIW